MAMSHGSAPLSTLSALSTIPIDVLVAQVQQASQAGKRVRITELWANARAQGGLAGVVRFSSRGFYARVAHVALTTLMMKTCASSIYEWVQARREKERAWRKKRATCRPPPARLDERP